MPDQDLDAELRVAVDAWRQRHGLPEDDPVILLVELLQLHQRHWDARQRQRADADSPSPIAGAAGQGSLPAVPVRPLAASVPASSNRLADTPWLGGLAILIAALGGYVLGRVW